MEAIREMPLEDNAEHLMRKWSISENDVEEEEPTTLDKEITDYETQKNLSEESEDLTEKDYQAQLNELSQQIIGDYTISDFVKLDMESDSNKENIATTLEVKTTELNKFSYKFLKLIENLNQGISERYLESLRNSYVQENDVELKDLILKNLLERNKKKEAYLLDGYKQYLNIINNIYKDLETSTNKAEKLIALARRIENERTSLGEKCIGLKRDIETILVESDSDKRYLVPALKKKLKQLEKKAETREKIYQLHIPSDIRTLRARVEYLNSFVQDLEYDKSLLASEHISTEEKRVVLETMLRVHKISTEFSNINESYDEMLGPETDTTIKLLQKEIGLHRQEKESRRKKRYLGTALSRLLPKTKHNYELLDIAKTKEEAKKTLDEGEDFFRGLEQEKRTRLFNYS